MRIIGGRWRGRVLKTPKGPATRPTAGMVRETLFNILKPRIVDARLLDLYAGCGSVGLEAVSHGAARAVLVESARPALACARENIARLDTGDTVTLLPLPVARALEQLIRAGEMFEIIFLDPPFADVAAYTHVLSQVAQSALLAPEGVLVAQHDARLTLPETVGALSRTRLHTIGDNALSFYRRAT